VHLGGAMTPYEFIRKWQNSKLKERAAAQEHFLDLCRLLGEKTPAESDPTGKDYAFEVGATKTTGGKGFADVFKRGHFGWEYKGTHANLDTAFAQLQRYAVALDNPPLLIVCDVGTTIRIHTNWTNSVSRTYEIAIAELDDPVKRGWLKSAFNDPEALRPSKTRQQLTEEVAGDFAALARSLRHRGHDPHEVAHFINRLVFCMFAEDVKLLKDGIFTRMLERALEDPAEFTDFAADLFRAMSKGGRVGFEKVAWFNGGLFDNDTVFALTPEEIRLVHKAALMYWGDIDPSILGTLFERGLDPDKRSQLGAHYTDREKIMLIIEPVLIQPLAAEWTEAKNHIASLMEKAAELDEAAKTKGGRAASTAIGKATSAIRDAQLTLDRYLQRLKNFRVLDPACGSGNFLYLALRALKDLEHRAQVEAEALGLPRGFPSIGPEAVRGIEINPYAAELARVSVWIGDIQWMIRNGFEASHDPILKPLETIECRDAVLNQDGSRAGWPDADVVVGNPPFIGDKKMIRELGEKYTTALRTAWDGIVPGGADFVTYWFAKSWEQVKAGIVQRVGLVSTNSIRGGANNQILKTIASEGRIFNAWADEPWVVDGAAVRVSLVCFDNGGANGAELDGISVPRINNDLTGGVDLQRVAQLPENAGLAFQGTIKVGPFDITAEQARALLTVPINVNGRPNSDVVRPWSNAMDITRRPSNRWIIDFGTNMPVDDAALYERPFEMVLANVKPMRDQVRRDNHRQRWWVHGECRPGMRKALEGLKRYIVTPRVAKHRIFTWLSDVTLPDCQLVVTARDDDTTFGILHSRFHEIWALRLGTSLEDRPRYTPSTTFDTFPFPEGLTPNIPASDYADDPRATAIAEAAARLNELREKWLNPDNLVRRQPEVVPDYPDRILPVSPEAAKILQKRTLTNLYNERPAWLDHAHGVLDGAVAAAYGWPADLSDDEVLAKLFALNQDRAAGKRVKARSASSVALEGVD